MANVRGQFVTYCAARFGTALASSTASEEVKTQAKALRDEGEALHTAGNHAESMAKLAEAETLLGIAQ